MPVHSSDIALAHSLADAAGAVIRPYFRRPAGLELKADQSPVTRADREAEAAMRRLIEAERSGDGIMARNMASRRASPAGNGCWTRSTAPAPSPAAGRSSAR